MDILLLNAHFVHQKQPTGDKKNTAQNERYLSGISSFSMQQGIPRGYSERLMV